MGRKLDLSGLTDDETEHVLQVVQRDFNLRKKEEERLSEMKQKLAEEGSKCSILSKHQKFVEHCCMRCCSPFTFLVNTKRRCADCKFNVCKSCCSYQKHEKVWICCVCQQARLLRTQSLEWFYNNVKSRFKRFGSAKVLKNLYRKHRLESGACFDILGGNFFEANLENEGSISGSDSTFYRQSEGHSMMDTLAVALRVAEEAIEEAISKAEAYGDSLDKQNEASYLRDHKEELTEELATTILQKIIRKQKSKGEQPMEEEPEWSQPQSSSAEAADEGIMAPPGGSQAPSTLWRSQSSFSLPKEDALKTPSLEATSRPPKGQGQPPREEAALPSWKSMDRLDETNVAEVLQSPDGNWLALKDGTLPPTRLLAKPKSGTFQALEAASSVASAYDEMGSDSEEDFDWSEALSTLCPRPRGRPRNPQPQPAQAQGSDQGPSAASLGLSPNPEAMCSDSETSSAGSSREAGHRARLSWLQRKAPGDPEAEKMRLQGELDVNFNPQAASRETSDSSEPEEAPHTVDRKARRWRRARLGSEEPSKELSSPNAHSQGLDVQQVSGDLSETDIGSEAQHPRSGVTATEEKLRNRLYELAMKMSEKETSSGEDQESEPKTESENHKESLSSEDNSQGVQEELKKKYSAVSLCNISTEVLKVINATEELIAESAGPWEFPPVPPDREKGTFPLGTDQVRLDEQLTSLEENVYLAAGTVYGLEGQLNELEDAARCIHSGTNETELADLEDQVATAAAQVHHAELQISDIESRISALTIAGLNIAPCVRLTRKRDQKQRNQVQTIDTSRQQRRKLPAPPVKAENIEASSVTTMKTFNRNFILQGSSTNRTNERKSTTKDLMGPATRQRSHHHHLTMAEDLVLEKCDLELEANGRDHHTAGLCQERLMVRWGQPFWLTLHFTGHSYEFSVDSLTFSAVTGPDPSEEAGTKAHFSLSSAVEEGAWTAVVMDQQDSILSLQLSTPPNAPVALYRLSLEASTGYQGSSFVLGHFTLLFNSWCPAGAVYLDSDEERWEYVLSQQGFIYQGSVKFIKSIPWNFGQFEDGILDICLMLLDRNPKFLKDACRDCSSRSNPIYVGWVVSAMVNCNDDQGVLLGRWDNNYKDGISPMFWISSVDILQRWKTSGCQRVKYGQCWVFAAVACTVLRCLSIPTRVVTNFNSAHDQNSNLLIEYVYNKFGEIQKEKSKMIWNYHCWVESWMSRPDLQPGYEGWQALDPTPQEKSEGTYCCGPVPVPAIKEGDLSTKYDAAFVFAEVNTDVVNWIQQDDGSLCKSTNNSQTVGMKISTKSVARDEREDITHNYKYPEGSPEEREAFRKANHLNKLTEKEETGLAMRIRVSKSMSMGSDFDVFAYINNNTSESHTCRLLLHARTVSYNGILGPECGTKDLLNLSLEPFSEKSIPLRILYEKYCECLTESNLIKVRGLLVEQAANNYLLAERDIYLENPEIKIGILGEPKRNRKLVAEASLRNPLTVPLLGCSLTMEGAGLTEEQKVMDVLDPVEAGEEVKARVDLLPRHMDRHKLVVNFESDKL